MTSTARVAPRTSAASTPNTRRSTGPRRATNVADPLLKIMRDMQYVVLGVVVFGLLIAGLPRFEHQQSTNDRTNQEAMR